MKRRHAVLAFLIVLGAITMADRVNLSVCTASIQRDLAISPAQWGWILGAFSIAYGVFEVPGGAAGDRSGPRRVLTQIVGAWSIFTFATGLVASFWQLLVVRACFGAGEAGAFPNASVAIRRWFPLRERARAQGFVWMASRVGGALTPVIVIPVQHAFGWRMSFYLFGGIGLIWAASWFYWFRDFPEDRGRVPADPGASNASPQGAGPAAWSQVLRQSNFWWILIMYHCLSWSGYFFQSWIFPFLEKGRNYTGEDLLRYSWAPFAFGACANVAGGFVGDWLVGKWGLKWGRRLVGTLGLGLSSIFVAATILTQDKILSIGLLAVGYACSDFMLPSAWALCLDVGGENAGSISGAMNMAGQFGGFFTSLTFGYIVNATGSYNVPLAVMALMLVVAAAAWFKIDPCRQIGGAPALV